MIVYSPMGSGLLTGAMTRERIERLPKDDWRGRSEQFEEPRLSKNLALVERLKTVASRLDSTPGAVAVAWALRNPAVDGAIVGFLLQARFFPSSTFGNSNQDWGIVNFYSSPAILIGAVAILGIATAAHNPTAGNDDTSSSTCAALMFLPPRMMMSEVRPTTVR